MKSPSVRGVSVRRSRSELRPVVLVLAAGRGERFTASGGQTHKLDALLDGVSVLERVLRAVDAADLAYFVVTPAEPRHQTATSPVYCTDGMGDAIASGIRATADSPGWLVLPGDLPLVAPTTLQRVARLLERHTVVVPHYRGRPGHPVGFQAVCGPALTTLSGDRGAAQIVHAYRKQGAVLDLAVDDAGGVTDIDTMDDLARAAVRLSDIQLRETAEATDRMSHGHH